METVSSRGRLVAAEHLTAVLPYSRSIRPDFPSQGTSLGIL